MKTIKERRLVFLKDTVAYYSEDVNRRAIADSSDEEDYAIGMCRYLTNDGRKCAIGRHISAEMYEKSIEGEGISKEILSFLPKEIAELGEEFLSVVQGLHDADDNWTSKGISKKGKRVVSNIKNVYIINEED